MKEKKTMGTCDNQSQVSKTDTDYMKKRKTKKKRKENECFKRLE